MNSLEPRKMINHFRYRDIIFLLRYLRKQKNFSEEDLEKFLDLPQGFVKNYEEGKEKLGIEDFFNLSEILNFSPHRMISWVEDNIHMYETKFGDDWMPEENPVFLIEDPQGE